MSITINFTIPSLAQLIVYLIIGFVVAVLIGFLGRLRAPITIAVFVIISALGGWLVSSFIQLKTNPEVAIMGVHFYETILGALIIGFGAALFMTSRKIVVK